MSLRTKLALILLLATVLPFGLGAAAVSLVVAPAYRKEVSRGSVQMTRRLAEHVAWNMVRDLTRLERMAAWDALRQRAADTPISEEETDALRQRWDRLSPNSALLRQILENPVARELRWWQQTDVSAAEIFVTDAQGRVVAASGKTSDFLQADEPWWQYAWAGGKGKVYISDVHYDQSVGAWAIDVAVPVYADGAPGSPAVGVINAVMDVGRAFQDLTRVDVGDQGEAMLVDRFGRVTASPEAGAEISPSVAAIGLQRLRENPTASITVPSEDGASLYAWAKVPLSTQVNRADARLPVLYALTRRSTSEAFGPLRMVQTAMLIIATLTIAAAVGIGYWLADAWVARPVRRLATGMRELARGDFEKAAAIADRLSRGQSANGKVEESVREEPPTPSRR